VKLVLLWAVWIEVYLATYYAPEFYFEAFNFFNACASLLLITVCLMLFQTWWAKLFFWISFGRIVLEVLDAFADLPESLYDIGMAVWNIAEALVLFAIGGYVTLRQWLNESARNANNSGRSPSNR